MLAGETKLSDMFENQPVKSSTRTGPGGMQYPWPDKDLTCKDPAVVKHFVTEEKAREKYDDAMKALNKADDDGAHQKAVDAVRKGKSGMATKPGCI